MREKGWYWVYFRDADGEGWEPVRFDPRSVVDGVSPLQFEEAWFRDGKKAKQPSESASNHWTVAERIQEPKQRSVEQMASHKVGIIELDRPSFDLRLKRYTSELERGVGTVITVVPYIDDRGHGFFVVDCNGAEIDHRLKPAWR